jgi:hypothetical protein
MLLDCSKLDTALALGDALFAKADAVGGDLKVTRLGSTVKVVTGKHDTSVTTPMGSFTAKNHEDGIRQAKDYIAKHRGDAESLTDPRPWRDLIKIGGKPTTLADIFAAADELFGRADALATGVAGRFDAEKPTAASLSARVSKLPASMRDIANAIVLSIAHGRLEVADQTLKKLGF